MNKLQLIGLTGLILMLYLPVFLQLFEKYVWIQRLYNWCVKHRIKIQLIILVLMLIIVWK